jgi:hypothetical protein
MMAIKFCSIRAVAHDRIFAFLIPILFSLFISFPVSLFSQEDHFNHTDLNWCTIETEHFYVHYHNGAERTAKVVAKVAEEVYDPITSLYEHIPDQKVSFVIKDYDDYSNGGAYFYDNKIEIWAPALDFDLRGTHNWLRNVVTHEFTHIIQIQTSMKFGRRVPGIYFQWLNYEEERRQDVLYGYPNVIVSYPVSGFVVPSWFAEGTAQYNRPQLGYESWDSHRDMILRTRTLDSTLLTWNEMGVFGKTSLGNESAYNSGFAFVRYISQHYGDDAVKKISREISRPDALTIDGAIERAIGKDGEAVYNEWKKYLTEDYQRRVEPIRKKRVEGDIIASSGFGNFYPAFSPNGNKIAYTSNKEADYFGLSSLYLYDCPTNKEKKIIDHVRSSLSWSPDGNGIFYSKISNDNPHWSGLSDIYSYDLSQKEEKRLTHGLRAHNPSLSPDGKTIVFATGSDGTMNVGIIKPDGSGFKQLTNYKDGEQIFTPKWSPDGTTIVFGFAKRDEQDIAKIDTATGIVEILIEGKDDSRNPVYTADGKGILFASDRTGIFNIYRYDVDRHTIEQITNVLGGAVMPASNANSDIAIALYTAGGYKISLISSAHPDDFSSDSYMPAADPLSTDSDDNKFNWQKLRVYDDTKLPDYTIKPYKNIFTSLTIIPVLRIDNYNTKNKGIDFLKPGFYFLSSDVIDKLSIFGGASMNHLFERDLFFMFEYRGGVVGLKQLGLEPTLSFEVYNITRKSSGDIELGLDRYSLSVTYGLLEFDIFAKQHLFTEADVLTLGFTNSRYSADIGSFTIPGDSINAPLSVPGSSDLYFRGNELSALWEFRGIVPSRHSDINPIGRKIWLRYGYEMDRFNSTGEYEATETGLTPKLTPFSFHKVELKYLESFSFPGWSHTLSFHLRGGTIFGPEVPDFFNYYAGGLIGMRGYPYYAIGGNDLAVVNLTYRFPLWENIDLRFMQLYFDKLYASFHTDYGNAWNGTPSLSSFKKDAGFELRLESYSFYAYPTRIFFNGTYGFDAFTYSRKNVNASYGKEWRFYFGVLFGFDVD